MESEITIKATKKEMSNFFYKNNVCSVRYFEPNGYGTYLARIRHAERKRHLYGTFTIPQIIKRLGVKNPLELTDKMVGRNDEIDNAVYNCILALTEKNDEQLPWDMEIIGEIEDVFVEILTRHGFNVRHPGIITNTDGRE